MEQEFYCKKCGGRTCKIINEQTKIERELSARYLILLIVFSIISLIGIIVIIVNAISMKTMDKVYYSQDVTKNIILYLEHSKALESYQSNIYIGIGLTILGFVLSVFTAIYHNIDASYNIHTETKKLCLTCGKKWKFKKVEQENFETQKL